MARKRFNPNWNTPTGHTSCWVSARAKIDKNKHLKGERKVIVKESKAKPFFTVIVDAISKTD